MSESHSDSDKHRLRADLRIALTGAMIAAVLMGGIEILIGNLRDREAQVMIGEAIPTLRAFASTIMIVTSSSLALMLTILGLTGTADQDVKGAHFERIRHISLAATIVFIAAAFLFATLVVGPDNVEGVPVQMFDVIYYVMTWLSALIGGAVVGIVLLIYTAVRDISRAFDPEEDSPLEKE